MGLKTAKIFCENIFFSELASAQKLLTLFFLRKFCSVANLILIFLVCPPRMNFYQDIRKFIFW